MYGTTSARIRYSTRCLETRVMHTFHVCGLRVVVFFHRTQGNALVEMSQVSSGELRKSFSRDGRPPRPYNGSFFLRALLSSARLGTMFYVCRTSFGAVTAWFFLPRRSVTSQGHAKRRRCEYKESAAWLLEAATQTAGQPPPTRPAFVSTRLGDYTGI